MNKELRQNAMEFSNFSDLVFILLDHEDGSKVAIEGNHGLAVFGDTIDELSAKISLDVQVYFSGGFEGEVRIREVKDTVIKVLSTFGN